MSETRLDRAHDAMQAAPEDDTARLAFYAALADGELFVLLSEEPQNPGAINPEILDIEGKRFALVFDSEARLSEFAKPPFPSPAPYAALPGRVIAGMLAGQNIGLGLNLGVAPSSILIAPEAMDWLMTALGQAPEEAEGAIREILAPNAADRRLLAALEQKLATAGAVQARAWLARAHFDDGRESALLAFSAVPEASQPELARAAQEALVFSGLEVDLTTLFISPGSILEGKLLSKGAEIPLPRPAKATISPPPAPPGSDPDKPPILK